MKRNRKLKYNLWVYFTVIVFFILIFTAIIMTSLAYLLYKSGHLTLNRQPLGAFRFFTFMSAIIGTSLSAFVAKKILKPITTFSQATDEIAKGNFDLRIDENSPIEEIRDLAKNFNTMVQELSSIETFRSDFIANVSHEFKTPIATIEGYTSLLQDPSLSKNEHKEYTEMIIHSTRRLNSLSSNILSLSKLENQEIILENNLYRLDEQIRHAVLMLEPEWNNKNLDFQIELIKAEYFGNEDLLMQVWLNLISNSIKFTPESGTIKINLYEEDNSYIFNITDTGIGIDQSNIDSIFDKFYQGDETRKTEGNGLGLSLVKRIIDLSNGSITVDSRVNHGASFIIKLPFLNY